jgi:transcription elongation factor GreB
MTPSAHKKMLDEVNHLLKIERPKITKTIAWAAGNGDRSENADYIYGKKRLREIDSRLRFLQKRLHNSQVINPLEMQSSKVQFSSTVEVIDDNKNIKKYIIVGIDEVDPKCGKISWRSPLGKELIGKEVGDDATIKAPKGDFEVEIISIKYEEIP